MSRIRIELNSRGIEQLLKSPAVQADLKRRARAIAAAAGAGMEPSVVSGRNRSRASVITGDFEAMRAEATTRALTSAVDAGRR